MCVHSCFQWPNREPCLRPWAYRQSWKGSANDCRTKAKCLAVRRGGAGTARLPWSGNRVQREHESGESKWTAVGGVHRTHSCSIGSLWRCSFCYIIRYLCHTTPPHLDWLFFFWFISEEGCRPLRCRNSLLKCPIMVLHPVKRSRIV